jgi:large subunit ribosomal protein L6
VEAARGALKVTGPKGSLEDHIPADVVVRVHNGEAVVEPPPSRTRSNRGNQGLARALLANMVRGVTEGYEKKLEINGVGYKAEQKGNVVTFTLGYSHTIDLTLPTGVAVEIPKQGTAVTVRGIDKQAVGQFAATIRSLKIPEPYKAKGVKYADEVLIRKVGKSGAK